MKKLHLLRLLVLFASQAFLPACSDLFCSTGTLEYSNTSICTLHEIIIDGVSHGFVNPGQTLKIDLEHGKYLVVVRGDGICGYGCSPGQVSISSCKTSSISCDN